MMGILKLFLSFVQDINRKPQVDDLGASDLTKEDFGRVDLMIQQNIFAGHQITSPALFGIKTEGQLGGRTEIRDAYEIFKNTYVNDKQRFLESVFNQLGILKGTKEEMYIQPVEPISFEFSEGTIAANAPKEWILEKMGIDPTKYQTVQPEAEQSMVNEHLKGMKGREWQNFQRIIREYTKGKITRDQAVQMLKNGYGLDEDSINTWLGEEEMKQQFNDIDSVIGVFGQFGEDMDKYNVIATRQVFSGDIEEQELKFRDEMIDDTTDKKILDVIAKNKRIPPVDIAKAVKIDVDEVMSRINKLVELEVLKYDPETKISTLTRPLSEIINAPVKKTFLVRYAYEFKSIVPEDERDYPSRRNYEHPSRAFCFRLMELKKFWSRTEIEEMSKRLGFSVFDRGGGWWGDSPSCRHQWVSKIVVKK